MHYVVSDIHNDNRKFNVLLRQLDLSEHDHLFILGDLFDRSSYALDPAGVYFNVLGLGRKCTVVQGNHDRWLAEYILNYYQTPERQRTKLNPYLYNSFELLSRRLTAVDMQDLAKWILSWPIQLCFELENKKYLFAHAMTSIPEERKVMNIICWKMKRTRNFSKREYPDIFLSVDTETWGNIEFGRIAQRMYMYVIAVVVSGVADLVACAWKTKRSFMCNSVTAQSLYLCPQRI